MKKCTKCGETKPLEEFYKDKRRGNRFSRCKKCFNAHVNTYSKAHPEKAYARKKAWRAANSEKAHATDRAWFEANKAKVYSQDKARRKANPEKFVAQAKARREADPEKYRASVRAYHKRNLKKVYAQSNAWHAANPKKTRAWRDANKEKLRANSKVWRKANREKCVEYVKKHRAKKLGAAVGEQPVLTSVVAKRDKYKCYLCGKRLKKTERTIDHVIPLTKGGAHSYENVKLCCQPCNSSKHARLPQEHTRIKNMEALSGAQLQLLSPGGGGG